MAYSFSYGCVESQANQLEVLQATYSLRYQVYINEWEFENPEDHSVGLEFDDYDACSIHFYARCRTESKVIGTVRTILNSNLGFPIERHFDLIEEPKGLDRDTVGEISRLAVSKEFRRRAIDNALFEAGTFVPNTLPRYMDQGRDVRRHCEHELVRGLYLLLYRDSKERGLTHWYAVMTKGLYLILKRWGIPFHQIGAAKDYHGLRAPYLVSIETVEQTLERKNPDLITEARRPFLH
jgi:N-acyl amino acid synthase of PEP-CTERM/exosortase system